MLWYEGEYEYTVRSTYRTVRLPVDYHYEYPNSKPALAARGFIILLVVAHHNNINFQFTKKSLIKGTEFPYSNKLLC